MISTISSLTQKTNSVCNSISTRNRQSMLSNRQSVSSSPKVPAWEVIVDQHLSQCLRAAKHRDFTYFRLSAALSAQPDVEHVDYKATLFSIIHDEQPIRQLEALNKTRCTVIGDGFQAYTSEIKDAKDEGLSWLDWGRLMDLEEERVMGIIVGTPPDRYDLMKLREC
jgi:hypothetical protein